MIRLEMPTVALVQLIKQTKGCAYLKCHMSKRDATLFSHYKLHKCFMQLTAASVIIRNRRAVLFVNQSNYQTLNRRYSAQVIR